MRREYAYFAIVALIFILLLRNKGESFTQTAWKTAGHG